MIGFEEREKIAFVLGLAANLVGKAVSAVEEMARRDIETVRDEADAADAVCISGPEIIKALRTIQRRHVR